MGVATSIILGTVALGSTAVGMAQGQVQADHNAKLAELEGQEQREALESEARRLAEDQREMKSSSRVAIAAEGGGSMQEQPLMLLAEQANAMQLDQFELMRRGRIAESAGKSKSLLFESQGKQAMLKGAGTLASQGYGLYQGASGAMSKGGTSPDISYADPSQFSYDLGYTGPSYLRR